MNSYLFALKYCLIRVCGVYNLIIKSACDFIIFHLFKNEYKINRTQLSRILNLEEQDKIRKILMNYSSSFVFIIILSDELKIASDAASFNF